MAGAWSSEARRALYERRYGADEGAQRFQAWQDKHGIDEEVAPQGGDITGERAPAGSGRRTYVRRETVGRRDMEKALQWMIAKADEFFAGRSPVWAAVPRLSGGAEILEKEEGPPLMGGKNDVERLASAIAGVPMPKFLTTILGKAKKTNPWLNLALTAGFIVGGRIVRSQMEAPSNAADVESGGAHVDHRDDGQREEPADGYPAASYQEVLPGAEVEGGLDQVSGNGHGSLSFRDPRFSGTSAVADRFARTTPSDAAAS